MIESRRLYIRPWTETDADHYMTMASDIGYTSFSPPGFFAVKDTDEARRKIAQRIELFKRSRLGKFPLFLKETGEFIGTCGMDPYDLEGKPVVELGYRLCLTFWGKGFAREAAHTLLHYGFENLGLASIYAFALPQNAASIKVLRSLKLLEQGECIHADLPHRLFVAEKEAFTATLVDGSGDGRDAIETSRLVLKRLAPSAAEKVASFQLRNRKFMTEHEPPRPANYYTADYWRQRLSEFEDAAKEDKHYSYFMLAKDQPETIIGWVNFSNVVRGAFHACHLGYNLSKDAEGRGYMVEALTSALAYMFEEKNLHRIMANYVPSNQRSERVLQKLGFLREGLAKDYLLLNGQWKDHVLTSLINPNWKAR